MRFNIFKTMLILKFDWFFFAFYVFTLFLCAFFCLHNAQIKKKINKIKVAERYWFEMYKKRYWHS